MYRTDSLALCQACWCSTLVYRTDSLALWQACWCSTLVYRTDSLACGRRAGAPPLCIARTLWLCQACWCSTLVARTLWLCARRAVAPAALAIWGCRRAALSVGGFGAVGGGGRGARHGINPLFDSHEIMCHIDSISARVNLKHCGPYLARPRSGRRLRAADGGGRRRGGCQAWLSWRAWRSLDGGGGDARRGRVRVARLSASPGCAARLRAALRPAGVRGAARGGAGGARRRGGASQPHRGGALQVRRRARRRRRRRRCDRRRGAARAARPRRRGARRGGGADDVMLATGEAWDAEAQPSTATRTQTRARTRASRRRRRCRRRRRRRRRRCGR